MTPPVQELTEMTIHPALRSTFRCQELGMLRELLRPSREVLPYVFPPFLLFRTLRNPHDS